jgi:hypothetical protein
MRALKLTLYDDLVEVGRNEAGGLFAVAGLGGRHRDSGSVRRRQGQIFTPIDGCINKISLKCPLWKGVCHSQNIDLSSMSSIHPFTTCNPASLENGTTLATSDLDPNDWYDIVKNSSTVLMICRHRSKMVRNSGYGHGAVVRAWFVTRSGTWLPMLTTTAMVPRLPLMELYSCQCFDYISSFGQ